MSQGMGGIRGPRQVHSTPVRIDSRDQSEKLKVGQSQGRRITLLRSQRQLLPQSRTSLREVVDRPRPTVRQRLGAGDIHLRLRGYKFAKLTSAGRFRGLAGRPKSDTKFWFFGTRTISHSTGYKNILNKLESYHTNLKAEVRNEQKFARLSDLKETLSTLGSAADRYGSKWTHSRKEQVAKLSVKIASEQLVVDDVIGQLGEHGEGLPAEMQLVDILAYARAGIPVNQMAKFHREGIEPDVARGLVKVDIPLEALQNFLPTGISPKEAEVLYKAGETVETAKMYVAHNLRITPESLPSYKPENVREVPRRLGNGAFNTVYKTKYTDGTSGVFKPLPKPSFERTRRVERGWVANTTGIDPYNPQMAMRNLATQALARELGFDVIVETKLGIQGRPPELGLVMGLAKGKEGSKTELNLYSDPRVHRELTKLQLLDALTGQGDRHWGNYFIHKDTSGNVKVTGIDNDQCFGKKLTDPNAILQGTKTHNHGFRGCKLPEVITDDMAEAINRLTPERLDVLLKDKLSSEEIAATKQRLAGMKSHVQKLIRTRKVVGREDWSMEHVRQNTRQTSYGIRDMRYKNQQVVNRGSQDHHQVMQALNAFM